MEWRLLPTSSETALIVAIVFIEDLVAGLIFAYAAYWSFSIRSAVNNRYLRSQSLWLGIISIGLIPLLPTPAYTPNLIATLAIDIFFLGVMPLLVLAWIDSTVRLDRRSDPLLRDSLHWSKVRIAVWIGTIVLVLLPYGFLQSEITGTAPAVLLTLFIVGPYLPALVAGTPALLISARRSKNSIRRENLRWFGLFALFVLLSILCTSIASTSVPAIPPGFFYFLAFKGIYIVAYIAFELFVIVSAYCLYRCARSLAPVNRATEARVPTG
jgi:hypothetical protein